MEKKKIWFGLATLFVGVLLSGCGLSPEDQTATAVALTAAAATNTPTIIPTSTHTPTFTPTPKPTPTSTPTPVPFDLAVLVTGEDGVPIVGADVVLAEISPEAGAQTTNDAGQVSWNDLPGENVNLSIGAQGYFLTEMTDLIERGDNQVIVVLERDPHGLLPSEACLPGENLLYIEDFQDGEAQGWAEIELRSQEWDIGPNPGSSGDMVLFKPAEFQGGTGFGGLTFENAVWRLQFMPKGRPIFSFGWHWNDGGYDVDGTTVDWSVYQVWFHPPGLRVFRAQPPISTISLRDIERTMRSEVWHQIEISTYEGALEIWIDGARFLAYDDPQPLPEGYILLGVGFEEALDPESVIYYDDLVVCELTGPFASKPMPEPETQ